MKTISILAILLLFSTFLISQEIIKYNLCTTSELMHNDIYSMKRYGDSIYVGQNYGLTKFYDDTYEHVFANTPYRYYTIADVLIINENEMWVVGPYTLGHLTNNEWEWFHEIDNIDVEVYYKVAIDATGRIWATTHNGLFMYYNEIWTHITEDDGVLQGNALAIEIDDNDVYVAFRDYEESYGVSKFDGENWINYTTENGLISNEVRDIHIDPYGFVWFCTGEGISKFNGNTWESFTTENSGLASNIVNCVEVDGDGNYWFGLYSGGLHGGGLIKFDGNLWEVFSEDDGLLSDKIAYLEFSDDNKLWIGTYRSGVSVMNLNPWEFGVERNIVRNGVNDFNLHWPFVSSDSTLWIQGNSNLTSFANNVWKSYDKSDITFEYPNILFEDMHGNLVFGAESRFAVFDGNEWNPYNFESPYPGTQLKDHTLDLNNNLWLASTSGVHVYDGLEWISYDTIDNLLHEEILHIDCDSENKIWCVAYNIGLNKFEDNIWSSYPFPDDLIAMYIDGFGIDHNDNIWITERHGVYQFDGENWMKYDTINGTDGCCYSGFAIDKGNNIWVGTKDLHKFDGSSWTTIPIEVGMPEGSIDDIVVDKTNNLWFTCNACLFKLVQSDVINFEESFNEDISCYLYPNPTIGSVNVEFEGEQVNIKMYTSTGKLVDDISAKSSPTTIDISNYSEGTYIFEITQGSKKTISKLIVTH